eukprot:2673153-Pyramimonas_sp.AAC.1
MYTVCDPADAHYILHDVQTISQHMCCIDMHTGKVVIWGIPKHHAQKTLRKHTHALGSATCRYQSGGLKFSEHQWVARNLCRHTGLRSLRNT